MMNFISFSDVKEIEKLEENTFYLFDSEPNVGDFLLKNQYNICCKASLWHVDLDCSKNAPGSMVESWTQGKYKKNIELNEVLSL